MATISTLAVNLIARTSAFEKGMKRGRSSVRNFKATIGKAIGTVARFAKGLALVGFGAMTVMVKRSLQALDVVSKLSRRINITTEALLGLRHAAELAGVTNQALDKSLEIFTRRMGEVKAGSGEATRGLEALGLSAEKMIKLTPEKALLVIADRIQTLGTQAEKSAAAYFLFGRSGAQLLNLFEGGAAGIKRAQEEAEKLGLTLKGFDLTKVEEANDAMTKFRSSIKAVFLEATIKLAPAIKKLANFMTQYRDTIISTTKKIIIFSVKSFLIIKAVQLIAKTIRILIVTYKALAAAQIVTLSLGGPAGWAILATAAVTATLAILAANKAINGAIDNIKDFGSSIDDIGADKKKGLSALPTTIAETEKQIKGLKRALLKLKLFGASGGVGSGFGALGAKGVEVRLKNLKRNLLVLKREEAKQKAIARIEAKRLKDKERFLALIKAEGESIKRRLEANLDLEKIKDPEKTPSGRFQQIRSEFIDVAALNPAANQVTELKTLNGKTDVMIQLMEESNRQAIGVFQA